MGPRRRPANLHATHLLDLALQMQQPCVERYTFGLWKENIFCPLRVLLLPLGHFHCLSLTLESLYSKHYSPFSGRIRICQCTQALCCHCSKAPASWLDGWPNSLRNCVELTPSTLTLEKWWPNASPRHVRVLRKDLLSLLVLARVLVRKREMLNCKERKPRGKS